MPVQGLTPPSSCSCRWRGAWRAKLLCVTESYRSWKPIEGYLQNGQSVELQFIQQFRWYIFTHGPQRWNRGSTDGLFLLLLLLLHTTNLGHCKDNQSRQYGFTENAILFVKTSGREQPQTLGALAPALAQLRSWLPRPHWSDRGIQSHRSKYSSTGMRLSEVATLSSA